MKHSEIVLIPKYYHRNCDDLKVMHNFSAVDNSPGFKPSNAIGIGNRTDLVRASDRVTTNPDKMISRLQRANLTSANSSVSPSSRQGETSTAVAARVNVPIRKMTQGSGVAAVPSKQPGRFGNTSTETPSSKFTNTQSTTTRAADLRR